MTLPEEERHTARQDYLEDELVVMMGGRVAEDLVFGVISNGAHSDLVYATESARRMVREWGMSDVVGPMAWGNRNQVFLGDEMLAARDYSDETARVIDEEVQRILTEQEARCRALLTEQRHSLNLIARALLERETVSGDEVNRLVELAADPSAGSDSDDASSPTDAGDTTGLTDADDGSGSPDTDGGSLSTSDGAQAAVSDPASTD